MAILPHSVFQPSTPSLFLLIAPSSSWQNVFRAFCLLYAIFVAVPLILLLVPLSVLLPSYLAPLPLHPHNLPPHQGYIRSIAQGFLVYITGSLIWSITSTGAAPDDVDRNARWLAQYVNAWVAFASWATGKGRGVEVELEEEEMNPWPEEDCYGVFRMESVERLPITGFWLRASQDRHPKTPETRVTISRRATPGAAKECDSIFSDNTSSTTRAPPTATPLKRQVILYLAGGGYVTGYPLVEPFLFSLIRSLVSDPGEASKGAEDQNGMDLLAPNIRKSHSVSRAFPAPLLDALAGYAHLRRIGYRAEDIIVSGDSAGGGLAWGLVAYLAALQDAGVSKWGVPTNCFLISPWLALPPTPPPRYPDLMNESQLLNAARCYLARFPVLPHRPDPFSSDWPLWRDILAVRSQTMWNRITRLAPPVRLVYRNRKMRLKYGWKSIRGRRGTDETIEQKILSPKGSSDARYSGPEGHLGWLDASFFQSLTSHHPLISPATDPSHPFVQKTFKLLKENGTRMLVTCGSAEWFRAPVVDLAVAGKVAGIEVELYEEVGGWHITGCLLPAEFGAEAGRLVSRLKEFVTSRPR